VTGAIVLAVDHFGKEVTTGTRGTSAKESSADAILALLGAREPSGRVPKKVMVVRKLRGGPVGVETPYSLQMVDLGVDSENEAITSCVVRWDAPRDSDPMKHRRVKSHELLTAAIEAAGGLPAERAKVQAAFAEAHRKTGKVGSTANAARMAFNRALGRAVEAGELAFGKGEMLVPGNSPI
jgi:hypothetical protein